jgi:hypothetical protein
VPLLVRKGVKVTDMPPADGLYCPADPVEVIPFPTFRCALRRSHGW